MIFSFTGFCIFNHIKKPVAVKSVDSDSALPTSGRHKGSNNVHIYKD